MIGQLFCQFFTDTRHRGIVGNARARVVPAALHFRTKPAVITDRLLFGFEFRNDRGEGWAHGKKLLDDRLLLGTWSH
ncbi:hypothetical protein AFM18_04345 [Achromobacter spanius]|uniref:Uncharacterized protein n=1 Tax=Achromobacter spanius TaxID=217203 RepID=A0AAW3I909_9BURK|nr:hypothetical protein AFM18_04345 [Achromobacter spanius]